MSVFLAVLGAIGSLVLIGTVIVFRRVFIDMAADGLHKPGGSHTNNLNKSQAAVDACMSAVVLIFGPTIVFILAYEYWPVQPPDRMVAASAALTAAILLAVLYRFARPIPNRAHFPWRNLLIIAMAGSTVALRDPFFVQVRPTLTNTVALVLAIGALTGFSSRLEGMFSRDGMSLDNREWRRVVAGSVLLFAALAAANEYVRRFQSEAFWVYFQLWGPPLFIVLFMIAGIFVIKRHMPAGQCPAKPRAERSEPNNDQ